jgi:magnesium transporter
MIRSYYHLPDQKLRLDIPASEYAAAIQAPGSLLWLDFAGEPDANCEPVLLDTFHFHPLAVDDALKETHTPKVDDWGEYIYIVLNSLDMGHPDGLATGILELDIFLGHNFIVTHHDEAFSAIDKVRETCLKDERYTSNGPDYLLYQIIDQLVAEYWPIVERIDADIDEIENGVFKGASPDLPERLFGLKRTLVSMRRIISPQREVLNRLARDNYHVIDPKDRILFRDLYDHLVRLHDLNESLRDLVGGTLDTYLSVVNNRMNEIMKTLTIITVLFMPITFVTGFFGMNYFQPVAVELGAWTGLNPFYVTMGILLFLPLLMLWWLRRRAWL